MQKIPLLSLAHANLLPTDVPTPLKEENIFSYRLISQRKSLPLNAF
jgi:hypothetical protein